MAGTPYWERFDDEAGEFRFRLVGANGEKMLVSEGYTRPQDRDRALEEVRALSPGKREIRDQQADSDA